MKFTIRTFNTVPLGNSLQEQAGVSRTVMCLSSDDCTLCRRRHDSSSSRSEDGEVCRGILRGVGSMCLCVGCTSIGVRVCVGGTGAWGGGGGGGTHDGSASLPVPHYESTALHAPRDLESQVCAFSWYERLPLWPSSCCRLCDLAWVLQRVSIQAHI